MKTTKIILMHEMLTYNGWEVTKDMIRNSKDSFINKPVVMIKGTELMSADISYLKDAPVVGVVKSVELQEADDKLVVVGEVELIKDSFYSLLGNHQYDNWMVEWDKKDKPDSFTYEMCVIYGDIREFDKLNNM